MGLIDANAFYENFEEEHCARCRYLSSAECEYCNVNDFLAAVDSQPRADAVPVVRCKDCKHSYENVSGIYCRCYSFETEHNFYCGDGDPKEGDE